MNPINEALAKILELSILDKPVTYMWRLYRIAQLSKIKNHTVNNIFKVINDNHLDIASDMPPYDAKALESIVQMVLRDNIIVAEIGSWKGMSTSVLAKTVKPFKGKVFAIDHWQGSEGVPGHKGVETNDILSTFRYNMKAMGVADIVYPMVMDSATASLIFTDNSLDLIFIDADHRYSQVKDDIKMWLPKVKQGGIICGHDCEEKYTKFGELTKTINEHLEEDVITNMCHPGVVKALYDIFQDNYEIVLDSKVWWKRI